MSFAWTTHVWTMDEPRRATHRLLLLALARFADDKGVCWPSVTTLAARCAAGRREVQRRLDWLETHGFIERDQRPGRSTMYRLTFGPRADGADGEEMNNTNEARSGTTPTPQGAALHPPRGGTTPTPGRHYAHPGAALRPPRGGTRPIPQEAAVDPPRSGATPTPGAALRPPEPLRNHHLTVSSRHAHARGETVRLAEVLPAAALLDKDSEKDEVSVDALTRQGVDEPVARRLVQRFPEQHVRAMLERGKREAKGPGWYIRAIEDGYRHGQASAQKRMTHAEALAWLERQGIVLSPTNPFTDYFDVVRQDGSTFFVLKQRPQPSEPGNT